MDYHDTDYLKFVYCSYINIFPFLSVAMSPITSIKMLVIGP